MDWNWDVLYVKVLLFLTQRDDRKQLRGVHDNVQLVYLTSACCRDRGRGGRRPGRQTFCAFAVLIRVTSLGKILFSLSVIAFICVFDIFSRGTMSDLDTDIPCSRRVRSLGLMESHVWYPRCLFLSHLWFFLVEEWRWRLYSMFVQSPYIFIL